MLPRRNTRQSFTYWAQYSLQLSPTSLLNPRTFQNGATLTNPCDKPIHCSSQSLVCFNVFISSSAIPYDLSSSSVKLSAPSLTGGTLVASWWRYCQQMLRIMSLHCKHTFNCVWLILPRIVFCPLQKWPQGFYYTDDSKSRKWHAHQVDERKYEDLLPRNFMKGQFDYLSAKLIHVNNQKRSKHSTIQLVVQERRVRNDEYKCFTSHLGVNIMSIINLRKLPKILLWFLHHLLDVLYCIVIRITKTLITLTMSIRLFYITLIMTNHSMSVQLKQIFNTTWIPLKYSGSNKMLWWMLINTPTSTKTL